MELDKNPLKGLGTWSKRFAVYRKEGRYDLCRQLLAGIKHKELPAYGLGIVRYAEGWLYDRLGNWQDALKAYHDSLAAFEQAGVPSIQVEIWTNIGSLFHDQGDWPNTEAAYQKALEIAEKHPSQRGMGGILHNFAGLLLAQDKTKDAIEYLEKAISAYSDVKDAYNVAACQVGLGTAYLNQNRSQEALDIYIEALQKFHQIGNLHGMGMASASIARLYYLQNLYQEAELQYTEALGIFSKIGDLVQINKTLANLGLVHQEKNELEQAQDYFEQALSGYEAFGDLHGKTTCLVSLGHLHHIIGNTAEAKSFVLQAHEIATKNNYEDQLTRLKLLHINIEEFLE